MDCKYWRAEELLPIVYEMAGILMKEPGINGVALTGSIARHESHCHDIDLVVFHNGDKENASFAHDSVFRTTTYSSGYGGREIYTTESLKLKKLVAESVFDELSKARGEIPVHYIFIHERILSDCNFLQSFLPRNEEKGFFARIGSRFKEVMQGTRDAAADEFYSTVFCDIPLVLVSPMGVRGEVLRHAIATSGVYMGAIRQLCPISHDCSNPRCKPKELWGERRWKVKMRQKYPCVEEELKRREAARGGISISVGDPGSLSYPQDGEISLSEKGSV